MIGTYSASFQIILFINSPPPTRPRHALDEYPERIEENACEKYLFLDFFTMLLTLLRKWLFSSGVTRPNLKRWKYFDLIFVRFLRSCDTHWLPKLTVFTYFILKGKLSQYILLKWRWSYQCSDQRFRPEILQGRHWAKRNTQIAS